MQSIIASQRLDIQHKSPILANRMAYYVTAANGQHVSSRNTGMPDPFLTLPMRAPVLPYLPSRTGRPNSRGRNNGSIGMAGPGFNEANFQVATGVDGTGGVPSPPISHTSHFSGSGCSISSSSASTIAAPAVLPHLTRPRSHSFSKLKEQRHWQGSRPPIPQFMLRAAEPSPPLSPALGPVKGPLQFSGFTDSDGIPTGPLPMPAQQSSQPHARWQAQWKPPSPPPQPLPPLSSLPQRPPLPPPPPRSPSPPPVPPLSPRRRRRAMHKSVSPSDAHWPIVPFATHMSTSDHMQVAHIMSPPFVAAHNDSAVDLAPNCSRLPPGTIASETTCCDLASQAGSPPVPQGIAVTTAVKTFAPSVAPAHSPTAAATAGNTISVQFSPPSLLPPHKPESGVASHSYHPKSKFTPPMPAPAPVPQDIPASQLSAIGSWPRQRQRRELRPPPPPPLSFSVPTTLNQNQTLGSYAPMRMSAPPSQPAQATLSRGKESRHDIGGILRCGTNADRSRMRSNSTCPAARGHGHGRLRRRERGVDSAQHRNAARESVLSEVPEEDIGVALGLGAVAEAKKSNDYSW